MSIRRRTQGARQTARTEPKPDTTTSALSELSVQTESDHDTFRALSPFILILVMALLAFTIGLLRTGLSNWIKEIELAYRPQNSHGMQPVIMKEFTVN